ncbi:putative lipid II flippase FtsW [Gammaproteobacteria bacterium]|nr:putative lipid II flippase FtsW [Gammaproteobacteria bacterium]
MVNKDNIFIILPFLALLFIGVIMVASSSVYIAEKMYGNPFQFAEKQLIFLCIGMLATLIAMSVPSTLFYNYDWFFLGGSLLLLLALLVPGIGTEVNGSTRWIRLGPINIQPSEISKLALLVYISGYCVRRLSEINTTLGFFRPLFVLAIFSFLIMSQPDLGSTLVISMLVIAILFFAGISFLQFILLLFLVGSMAVAAIFFTAFRYARLISFTDPFAYFREAGWQLGNALIGIGRGEWFGVGLGNGIQKNLYLPEPHTDFIFAVLVEEFGVAGSLILLALYACLIIGIIMTAIRAIELGHLFKGLLAFGTAILIALQALFNIGVNLGMLPTKGLTLPFISYGGTSLIIFMFMIGMVLRINYENRIIKS